MALLDLRECLKLFPAVQHSPAGYLWSSYDGKADVLSISFKNPS
jgi:hypothetical protein